MKLKTKFFYIMLVCFFLGFLTGCSKKEKIQENNTEVIETKAKHKVSECVKFLKLSKDFEETLLMINVSQYV